MSNDQTLNPSQVEQVKGLIAGTKDSLVTAVLAAMETRQAEVVRAAKDEIDKAVEKSQRVMITTVQDSAASADSTWPGLLWEGAKVLLPIIATALLGYIIWGWQANIQQKIDEKTKILEAQLNQKGAYFEHKLTVYEALHKQMAEVNTKVHAAAANDEKRPEAFTALKTFNELIDANRLYVPKEETHDALKQMWRAGAEVFRGGSLEDFDAKTRAAEKALGDDLGISGLNTL